MKDRIRKIRKSLDLTQKEFADRLGMKQNTIATYEMGRSNPSDPTILSICREFGVNEDWLRNGNGEMFVPEALNELDALAQKYKLTYGEYLLLEKWLRLPLEHRNRALSFIKEMFIDSANAEFDLNTPAMLVKKSPLKVVPVAGRHKGVSTDTVDPQQIEEHLNKPMSTGFDD